MPPWPGDGHSGRAENWLSSSASDMNLTPFIWYRLLLGSHWKAVGNLRFLWSPKLCKGGRECLAQAADAEGRWGKGLEICHSEQGMDGQTHGRQVGKLLPWKEACIIWKQQVAHSTSGQLKIQTCDSSNICCGNRGGLKHVFITGECRAQVVVAEGRWRGVECCRELAGLVRILLECRRKKFCTEWFDAVGLEFRPVE